MYYGVLTHSYLKYSCGLIPVFWLVRYFLNSLVFQPFTNYIFGSPAKKSKATNGKKNSKLNDAQRTKFAESLWKAFVYGSLHIYTWVVLLRKPWLFKTNEWWQYDAPGGKSQIEYLDMVQLYIVQTAFYLSSVGMLAFWETRRKDFAVMMAHHIVTFGLLLGSFAYGYTRSGSVILLLHDFSDIFLDIAKLFNYAGQETLSTINFVIMAASWGFLRLYIFPRYVIWSVMWEVQEVTGEPLAWWWLLNGLLWILVVMHFYWYFLILRVAVTVLKGSGKDVREDEE